MNILLVDDDAFVRKMLSFELLEGGHAVTLAPNGSEAIARIEQNHDYELVICDVMMPGLTGPSFLHMVERYYKQRGMPVIMLVSEVRDTEELVKKINVKYDYFLQKPLDMTVFRETLQTIQRQLKK